LSVVRGVRGGASVHGRWSCAGSRILLAKNTFSIACVVWGAAGRCAAKFDGQGQDMKDADMKSNQTGRVREERAVKGQGERRLRLRVRLGLGVRRGRGRGCAEWSEVERKTPGGPGGPDVNPGNYGTLAQVGGPPRGGPERRPEVEMCGGLRKRGGLGRILGKFARFPERLQTARWRPGGERDS
jgi:hypothetical protein